MVFPRCTMVILPTFVPCLDLSKADNMWTSIISSFHPHMAHHVYIVICLSEMYTHGSPHRHSVRSSIGKQWFHTHGVDPCPPSFILQPLHEMSSYTYSCTALPGSRSGTICRSPRLQSSRSPRHRHGGGQDPRSAIRPSAMLWQPSKAATTTSSAILRLLGPGTVKSSSSRQQSFPRAGILAYLAHSATQLLQIRAHKTPTPLCKLSPSCTPGSAGKGAGLSSDWSTQPPSRDENKSVLWGDGEREEITALHITPLHHKRTQIANDKPSSGVTVCSPSPWRTTTIYIS